MHPSIQIIPVKLAITRALDRTTSYFYGTLKGGRQVIRLEFNRPESITRESQGRPGVLLKCQAVNPDTLEPRSTAMLLQASEVAKRFFVPSHTPEYDAALEERRLANPISIEPATEERKITNAHISNLYRSTFLNSKVNLEYIQKYRLNLDEGLHFIINEIMLPAKNGKEIVTDPIEVQKNVEFIQFTCRRFEGLCLDSSHEGYLEPSYSCPDHNCQVRSVLQS